MANEEPNPVEAGYDAVYAAMPHSPTLRRIWREHAAGADFPDEFAHISFVTLVELQRMVAELRLTPGGTLVDLGCGLAGPALLVARATGAMLVGVDLSTKAVAEATKRAAALGLAEQARFVAGAFADSGLPDGVADAIMSEDALQYAPDKLAALHEAARIARPGARFVCTVFELDPENVASLPVLGVDPVDDYRPLLEQSGFTVDRYDEVPGWPEPMTRAYSAVLAAKEALTAEMGELAVASLSAEMAVTLARSPYKRRALIVASRN